MRVSNHSNNLPGVKTRTLSPITVESAFLGLGLIFGYNDNVSCHMCL